jgi:ankyrin repeat protein
VSHYDLTAFDWDASQKRLTLKHPLLREDVPSSFWVQGKNNRVKFTYNSDNHQRSFSYFHIENVLYPDDDVDRQIYAIIKWL